MARRTRRAAKKRLLKKILAPLLTLLAAALTGYSVWDYTGGASLPAAAMPEGALVSVQVIDVGQGSSLLLHTAEHSVLIDAGEREASEAVAAQLDAWGITSLDLMVLTHLHTDHYGGAVGLLGEYGVDTLWMPAVSEDLLPTNRSYEQLLDAIEQNGCAVELLAEPRALPLGEGITLSLLDGFVPEPDNLNDTSLCLRIDAGEASFLITGDGKRRSRTACGKAASRSTPTFWWRAIMEARPPPGRSFSTLFPPKRRSSPAGRATTTDIRMKRRWSGWPPLGRSTGPTFREPSPSPPTERRLPSPPARSMTPSTQRGEKIAEH